MMPTLRQLYLSVALLLGATLVPAHAQSPLLSLNNLGEAARVNLQTTTMSTLRTEFRIEALSPAAFNRYIWGLGEYPIHSCFILANSLTIACQFANEGQPNGGTTVDATGRNDMRIRWQRNPATATITIESWNGDCSGYRKTERPITNVLAPFSYSGVVRVGDNMRLGFLRWYDSVNDSGRCPVDAPVEKANLLDLRFEDLQGAPTFQDFSGRGQNMNSGGAGTTNSLQYDPRADIRGWTGAKPVFRASEAIELDGSLSTAFTGDGQPATYFWQQVAGPEVSRIEQREGRQAVITPPLAGQYTFRLTVRDTTGRSGHSDVVVGVVGASPNYVVSVPDQDLAWVLGSVAMHGKSAWPWYEVTEIATADMLAAVMRTPPVETQGPGTVRAATPPNFIDGQGRLTAGPSSNGNILWTGEGTNFTQADVGRRIVVRWDVDGDGSYRGRRPLYINTVLGPESFTTPDYQLIEPPDKLRNEGLSWAYLDTSFQPYNATDGASFIAMFYEAGLAVGRLYAKTGLETYRDQFHSFCDNWWHYGLGSGYVIPIPRNAGTHTMVACAADPTYHAPPGMWEGIARLTKEMAFSINTVAGSQRAIDPTSPIVMGAMDPRELSYVTRTTALLARLYGKRTGSFQPWCGYLKNQVNNIWIAGSAPPAGAAANKYSAWGENLFSNNVGYVAASTPPGVPGAPFGTSPWRSVGLPALALIYAQEALADPNACADTDTAKKLYDPETKTGLIARAANYIWDYGRSPDGGVFYAEGYDSDIGNTLGGTVFNNFPNNGTVNVVQGSSSVAGTGTYFLAQYGPCDGSTKIRLRETNYVVAACESDTNLTLAGPYLGATENGLGDYGNPSTIAVTHSSNVVTGVDTNFRTLYAPCDGSTYIGIVGNANSYADRRVYQVTSCPTDTSLTINTAYAGPTETGIRVYSRAIKAPSQCGPLSLSTKCEFDRYNGRNLSADIAAGSAWLYSRTGDDLWKNRTLYYANKTLGGPASGSGAIGRPSGSCTYNRSGSLSLTAGSTTVTGVATEFTKQFGPCNGSTRILIGDADGSWANPPGFTPTFHTYSVQSCTDTELTLSAPYEGATRSSVRLFYSPEDPQWNCADGGTGNLGEILPPCSTHPVPCGLGFLVPKYGKSLGMVSGAGDVPVMIGRLMGGLESTVNGAVIIEFNRQTAPAGAVARISVTEPDGKKHSVMCSTSPCQVPVNLKLGNPVVKLEYLDAGGLQVLAAAEPQVIRLVPSLPRPQLPLQNQPE